VRLFPPDQERLRRHELPVVVLVQPADGEQMEELFLLGTRHEQAGIRVCTAFGGNIGQACRCTIYADRPDVCRRFEVGDVLCLQARQKAGLPV
jgi:Fe-S-cluster containining protein